MSLTSNGRTVSTLVLPPFGHTSGELILESHVLPNGLRVYLLPLPHTHVVSARLLVPGGSGAERDDELGCAHFLEHMLFCGTPSRPTTHAITREVERLGALMNAETTKEDTIYSFVAPAHHAAASLSVLGDMLTNSVLPERSFETEREVIIEELKDNEDDLGWRCANLVETLVFGSSALSRPIIGTNESVRSMARENLIAFRDRWYTAGNIILVAAGLIGGDFIENVEKFLGELPLGSRHLEPPEPEPASERIRTENLGRDRTVMKLAFPIAGHREYEEPEITLAEIVLGQTSYSRLEQSLRLDHGLAYSLDCEHLAYHRGGYVEITAEVSPAKAQKALDALARVVTELAEHGATQHELDDAKTCATGRALLGTQTASDLADFISDELLTRGDIVPPHEQIARIQDVSLERLNDVTRRTFAPDRAGLAVCGKIPKRLVSPF
jgi:predicted Zn-dependent peptidase